MPGGFQFQVALSEPSATEVWAVQLWVADDAMVKLRRKTIAQIQSAIHDSEFLLSDPDHSGKECQDSIHHFIELSNGALQRLRDYDPFAQFVWQFDAKRSVVTVGVPQQFLARSSAVNGTAVYTGRFTLDRNLDVAEILVPKIAWGLALIPKDQLQPRPIRDPWILALHRSWSIQAQLSPDQAVLSKLIGKLDGGMATSSKDTYGLASLGEVDELGCYGADGIFSCPDFWKPIPSPILKSERPVPPGVQVAGYGPNLAVLRNGQGLDILHLRGRLSSEIEEGWEVLDLQLKPNGDIFLLAQGTGMTRPHGGSGMCGAGTEVDVVWVHFDPAGRVRGSKTVHVVQCDGSTGYNYSYNPARPEKMSIIKVPLEEN